MSRIVVLLITAIFPCAYAQDMPVPKMFKDLQGQKGQYQVELLEGGPARKGKPPVMTVCTDNLIKNAPAADKAQTKSDCKQRLLKDTADEAVIENVCKDRTSTVTIKREGKSMLMDVQSTNPSGKPDHMKIRYTHLGACREGQGAVGMDPNSEQCKKMREQAAQMDPAKQCARQQQNREACEKMVRDAAAQISSMCN